MAIRIETNIPEVVAGFSEKPEGNMKGAENPLRRAFLDKALPELTSHVLILPEIVHGDSVEEVDQESEPIIAGVDALITTDCRVALGVTFADCSPILLVDPKRCILAVVHAGVKGASLNIIDKVITAMREKKSQLEDIQAILGPTICRKHYSRSDAKSLFPEMRYQEFLSKSGPGIWQIDLPGIIKSQLLLAGVRKQNTQVIELCTYENANLFSYRRDQTNPVQAGLAVIGFTL